MKCNIARDLLPLYAEGLCGEETTRELEEHFAECKECAALKNDSALSEKSGGYEKEIKPFKKLHRRLRTNIFVIIALGSVAAAVLIFLGGLTYGELNPFSGWMSFSEIAHVMEVRKVAGLLEKGDIDGFAEHLHVSDIWRTQSAANSLLTVFKSAYKEELSGKNCKIINVDTDTLICKNDVRDYMSDVTLDYDGERITLRFIKQSSGYKVCAADGEELAAMKALNVYAAVDNIVEYSALMSGAPHNFVSLFSGSGWGEISKLYSLFKEDGSDIVYAYASLPEFNEDKGILQTQCCFKFRGNDGSSAILEFTADLNNYIFFSVDMSTISTVNQGMSNEKLEQIYDILRASA